LYKQHTDLQDVKVLASIAIFILHGESSLVLLPKRWAYVAKAELNNYLSQSGLGASKAYHKAYNT
jgi:hypothetical protein